MLLFVASEALEFSGLLKHVAEVRRTDLPVQWSRFGLLRGRQVLLVANGAGAERAAAAVDIATGHSPCEAIVNTGFCGALDRALAVGEIVAAQPPPQAPPHRRGTIHTADHVVLAAAEKAKLRASGAIAVEMEAAGVAARAAALALPFYCVKSVTDLAGETLHNDFNAALRPDGHFDRMVILRQALHHPTERLPELLRLRNRCSRATRALGDFFAECRF